MLQKLLTDVQQVKDKKLKYLFYCVVKLFFLKPSNKIEKPEVLRSWLVAFKRSPIKKLMRIRPNDSEKYPNLSSKEKFISQAN